MDASRRARVILEVANAEPVARSFGVTALATGPNGTRMQDRGVLEDGGAASALRPAPSGLAPEDGPALVRMRVASSVALRVEGRIHVDDEVAERGGSTVPGGGSR